MRAFTILMAGAAAFVLGAGVSGVQAQGLSAAPKEAPPAAFVGRQFVDSQGCVFVRAGRGDVVTWVPRVTRNRQQLCGYAPTRFAVSLAPVGEIRVIEPAPVAARSAARQPTQQRVVVSQIETVSAQPAPLLRPTTVPAVTVAPTIHTQPTPYGACGASALSAQYLAGCGAQAELASAPVSASSRQSASMRPQATAVIPPQTRNSTHGTPGIGESRIDVEPNQSVVILAEGASGQDGTCAGANDPSTQHLNSAERCRGAYYKWQSSDVAPTTGTVIRGPAKRVTAIAQSTQRIVTPPGYKEAWTDGRLNAFRGIGTDAGEAQMRRIWTAQVPQALNGVYR